MKLVVWSSLIGLALVVSRSASSQELQVPSSEVPNIPLCELLKAQSRYAGKIVTTTARITRGRHVTVIWDPSCRELFGADLQTADSARSNPSIITLDNMLREHGMGDYPVIATFTGILQPNQWDEHSFLLQPSLVFLASSTSNIHRSGKIERR